MKILITLLLSISQLGSAVYFDGVAAAINRRDGIGSAPLVSQTATAISLWYKRYNTNTAVLITKEFPANPVCDYGLRFNSSASNRLEFYFTSSSTHEVFATPPNTGSITALWQHVAFSITYITPSSATFWTNGILVSGCNWVTNAGGANPDTGSGSPMRIGSGQGVDFFKGELSEVTRFIGFPLNQRQVTILNSKVKTIPYQLFLTNSSGINDQPLHPVWYFGLNDYSAYTTIATVTNNIPDYSATYYRSASTVGSPQARPETVCSYYPME